MSERNRPHELTVRIDPAGDKFEAWIEEPGADTPHWTMSGPALDYEDAVQEVLDALKRHLLAED